MTAQPMMQEVQNPELMFRGPALPEPMRARLLELGYAPQATELLLSGLPIVYAEHGQLVVEYPDGYRIAAQRHKEYGQDGQFQRYRYAVVRALPPATR